MKLGFDQCFAKNSKIKFIGLMNCIISILTQMYKIREHFYRKKFVYRMPRLILLAVLKRIHKFQESKRRYNNEGIVAMDMSRNEFEDIKRNGKLI